MPLVRSVGPDADGFTVVFSDGSKLSFSSADVPSANVTVRAVEDFTNARLATAFQVRGMTAETHVTTARPLVAQTVVSDIPLPRGWWLI